jgi:hypothetical protein
MKTILLLSLLSTGCLLSAAEPAQPAPSSAALLSGAPAEITQFYHDVNFAACYSTPEERTLVSQISTYAADKLPKRLQIVRQTIQRIRETSTFIDPQIVHQRSTLSSPPEELTEIVSLQRDGNRIQVEVRLRSLTQEARSWLAAQYDKPTTSAGAPFILREVLKQTGRREMHTWVQVHGHWMRNEAGVVLLKMSGR